MGKARGGKFGRRTVLQLEDETTKKPAAYGLGYKPAGVDKPGSSILGGLIGSYGGDSDPSQSENEDEEDNDRVGIQMQAFVKSTDQPILDPASLVTDTQSEKPDTSNQTNGDAQKVEVSQNNVEERKEEPVAKKPPKDEVDAQLQDFLAEIDAMDTGSNSGAAGDQSNPVADQKPAPVEEELETDTSAEEEDVSDNTEPAPVKPQEPVTAWQHCLDEGTQYYYYWNTDTNEVTWSIPEGYSQYLLIYKEYEEKLAKYERDLKTWQERQENKPLKKKKMRKKKIKATPSKPPPPPRSLPPADTGRGSGDVSKPVIGPQKPTESSSLIGPQKEEIQSGQGDKSEVSNGRRKSEDDEDAFIYRHLHEVLNGSEKQADDKLGINRTNSELDIDIENELDLALEKKQSLGEKEKAPNGKEKEEDFSIGKSYLREQLMNMAGTSFISQEVLDKLQFLEVNRSGLSQLQILLIQLQTRITDWKNGGLRTAYLAEQVLGASRHLAAYEASAAPPGWSCRWHREYKRYYYSNLETDECQWEYPQEVVADPVMDQSETGTDKSQEEGPEAAAEEQVDFTSLAGAPPPPPPAKEQQPIIDEVTTESNADELSTKSAEKENYDVPNEEKTHQDVENETMDTAEDQKYDTTPETIERSPTTKSATPAVVTGLTSLMGYDATDSEIEDEAEEQKEKSEGEISDESRLQSRLQSRSRSSSRSPPPARKNKKSRSRSRSKSRSKKSRRKRSRSGSRLSSRKRSHDSGSRHSSVSRSTKKSRSRSTSRKRSRKQRSRSKSRSSSRSSSSRTRRRRKHKSRGHKHKKSSRRKHKKQKKKESRAVESRSRSRSKSRSKSRTPKSPSPSGSESDQDYDPTQPTDDVLTTKSEVEIQENMNENGGDIDGDPMTSQEANEESMENSTSNVRNSTSAMENSTSYAEPPPATESSTTQETNIIDPTPPPPPPPEEENPVNVISKPAHFAAAPVLIRPPATATITAEATSSGETVQQTEENSVNAVATEAVPTKASSKDAPSKEKKKKKDKSLSGGGLSMKKKGVNSLVQKWQQVQKQVEKD